MLLTTSYFTPIIMLKLLLLFVLFCFRCNEKQKSKSETKKKTNRKAAKHSGDSDDGKDADFVVPDSQEPSEDEEYEMSSDGTTEDESSDDEKGHKSHKKSVKRAAKELSILQAEAKKLDIDLTVLTRDYKDINPEEEFAIPPELDYAKTLETVGGDHDEAKRLCDIRLYIIKLQKQKFEFWKKQIVYKARYSKTVVEEGHYALTEPTSKKVQDMFGKFMNDFLYEELESLAFVGVPPTEEESKQHLEEVNERRKQEGLPPLKEKKSKKRKVMKRKGKKTDGKVTRKQKKGINPEQQTQEEHPTTDGTQKEKRQASKDATSTNISVGAIAGTSGATKRKKKKCIINPRHSTTSDEDSSQSSATENLVLEKLSKRYKPSKKKKCYRDEFESDRDLTESGSSNADD